MGDLKYAKNSTRFYGLNRKKSIQPLLLMVMWPSCAERRDINPKNVGSNPGSEKNKGSKCPVINSTSYRALLVPMDAIHTDLFSFVRRHHFNVVL